MIFFTGVFTSLFHKLQFITFDLVRFVLMETPISDQREEEQIDIEADLEELENEDTEDEELKFDPEKDLWVSVRVERRSVRERDSVSESYWVWEVERRAEPSYFLLSILYCNSGGRS